MAKHKKLKEIERLKLLNELEDRYAHSKSKRQKYLYIRKKYSWLFVVEGAKFVKRLGDILIASVSLILLSPFFLLIALVIKLYDKGPILYVVPRVGKWGKEFPFPKFRTMNTNAEMLQKELEVQQELPSNKRFKMKDDPRITPFGRWLRKTSLDELPQLWSVFVGNMSLVGPRPPLPKEVAQYTLQERRRLDVTPGLTCFWQVSGRSEIPFPEQVALDLQYIESQSLWVDIKILLKTIPAVIFGKGAY